MTVVAEPREARTPMALLPYQQRWCADRSQVKVIEKSRRVGLSWGEAADTALLAASTSGMNAFYIGYMKDMAKEFIADCASFAKAYSLAAGDISETEEVWFEGEEEIDLCLYAALPPAGASKRCHPHRATCAASRAGSSWMNSAFTRTRREPAQRPRWRC